MEASQLNSRSCSLCLQANCVSVEALSHETLYPACYQLSFVVHTASIELLSNNCFGLSSYFNLLIFVV